MLDRPLPRAQATTAVLLALSAAACATPAPYPPPVAIPPVATHPSAQTPAPQPAPSFPQARWSRPEIITPASFTQCAIYARKRTGVDIYGDAGRWWDMAAGRYARSQTPEVGAVIVLGGTPRGHVAVVTAVLSRDEILVDHANWLNDGRIQVNVPVRDVSTRGDWSAVRVWHVPTNTLGARTYPVKGFVLTGAG